MKKRNAKKAAPKAAERSKRAERPERDRSARKSKAGLTFDSHKMKGHVFGDLEVTEVRIALLDDRDSARKALASITLNDGFAVGGLSVILDGRKGGGLFVSMPQRKDGEGEYHDTCFPLTKEGRAVIGEAVLDAYDKAGGQ